MHTMFTAQTEDPTSNAATSQFGCFPSSTLTLLLLWHLALTREPRINLDFIEFDKKEKNK